MTYVSCLVLGLALAIAVGLLIFAGTLLGWMLPHWIDRFRRARAQRRARPPEAPK